MGHAKDVVDRIWTVVESRNVELFDELLAPDGEVSLPGGVSVRGPEQFKPFMQAYFDAFPDLRHTIHDYVESADGAKIALELRVTGTHNGVMRSPGGDIPPTGKHIVWESVDFITIADGKVKSWHTYFDQLAFLSQLGLVPQPA